MSVSCGCNIYHVNPIYKSVILRFALRRSTVMLRYCKPSSVELWIKRGESLICDLGCRAGEAPSLKHLQLNRAVQRERTAPMKRQDDEVAKVGRGQPI
jgi:hypothetical protein